MQSEYAQPFLGAKAWGGAGWATKGGERGTAPGGQHLPCAFIKGPAWWPGGGEDALLVHQEEPSPGAHPQVDYDSLVWSPVAECVLCALEQPFIFHLLPAPQPLFPLAKNSDVFNNQTETSFLTLKGLNHKII